MRRRIIANIEKYLIHRDVETDKLYGIEVEYYYKNIKPLKEKYGHQLKNFPDDFIIKCFPLIRQGKDETYKINLEIEQEVQLNKLDSIPITLGKW